MSAAEVQLRAVVRQLRKDLAVAELSARVNEDHAAKYWELGEIGAPVTDFYRDRAAQRRAEAGAIRHLLALAGSPDDGVPVPGVDGSAASGEADRGVVGGTPIGGLTINIAGASLDDAKSVASAISDQLKNRSVTFLRGV